MLDIRQSYVGTHYTTTVTLLIVAFVFSPAILILERSSGYVVPLVALACSAFSVVFAWIIWKKHSELTIPSIASPNPRAK